MFSSEQFIYSYNVYLAKDSTNYMAHAMVICLWPSYGIGRMPTHPVAVKSGAAPYIIEGGHKTTLILEK